MTVGIGSGGGGGGGTLVQGGGGGQTESAATQRISIDTGASGGVKIEEIKLRRFDGEIGEAIDLLTRTINKLIRLNAKKIITKRAILGPWYAVDLAADAKPTLSIAPSTANKNWVAHKSGSIVGYSFLLSEAAAGSTLKINILNNGATVHTAKIKTDSKYPEALKEIPIRSLVFREGDSILIQAETDASWTATTADLLCWLVVEI
jgi:hypothetical protein